MIGGMVARILILGGTDEARRLAREVAQEPGIDPISSLAGRVRNPTLPVGDLRVGGFGGVAGLVTYLREENIAAVVDATHPFAEQISDNAVTATGVADVPLLVLRRAGWAERHGDRWVRVPSLAAAAAAVDHAASRVFVTTGRQGLGAFADATEPWFLIRCVDPPDVRLPMRSEVILDRGPYTYDNERALMTLHGITELVTKDSGGELTVAKLDAARDLGLTVVVVNRPVPPDAQCVTTVIEAVEWLRSLASQSG